MVRNEDQNTDTEKIGYVEAGKVNKECWQAQGIVTVAECRKLTFEPS